MLIKRRDAIGRAYLTAVNPIVNPRLDATGGSRSRTLPWRPDSRQPPAAYRAAWSRFDNATGADARRSATTQQRDGRAAGARRLPSAAGSFVEIDI